MGLELFYQSKLTQLEHKIEHVEGGYADMVKNYDSFLKIVDTIVEKNKRIDRLASKYELEQQIKNVNQQISQIKLQLEKEQSRATESTY